MMKIAGVVEAADITAAFKPARLRKQRNDSSVHHLPSPAVGHDSVVK